MYYLEANREPTVNDYFLVRVRQEREKGNTETYLYRWEIPDIIYNLQECSAEDELGQCEVDIHNFNWLGEDEDEDEKRLSHLMMDITINRFTNPRHREIFTIRSLDGVEKTVLTELGYTVKGDFIVKW